jgi:hypothetical protein
MDTIPAADPCFAFFLNCASCQRSIWRSFVDDVEDRATAIKTAITTTNVCMTVGMRLIARKWVMNIARRFDALDRG